MLLNNQLPRLGILPPLITPIKFAHSALQNSIPSSDYANINLISTSHLVRLTKNAKTEEPFGELGSWSYRLFHKTIFFCHPQSANKK